MFKRFFFVIVLISAYLSASAAEIKNAKYIFLFIGDGMSLPQRMAAQNYVKSIGEPDLAMNSLAEQSIAFTRSNNSLITDSAASATAIACGEKTDNHFVGVTPKGERLESVAEAAKKAGKKVGIITSVTLNHATPAGFYAHNTNRGSEYEIALDLIESDFDYFAGGGIARYKDEKSKGYKGNIYDLAKEKGYEIFVGAKEFENIPEGSKKVIAVENKGGAMPYFIDNQNTTRLADFTKKGIELLDNPKGFFMMIEGGKIDWMCHANDAATTINEILEFDSAVKVAIDFAKKHPRETLIVVTGDHETGGLTLGFAGTGYKLYPERLKNQTCSLDTFKNRVKDGVKKGKIAEFDDVKEIVEKSFGLKFTDDKNDPMRLKSAEVDELKKNFERLKEKPDSSDFANCALRIFNNKCGIAWTSNAHTALPVPTSASGTNAQMFRGMFENTEISKNLKKIIGKPR